MVVCTLILFTYITQINLAPLRLLTFTPRSTDKVVAVLPMMVPYTASNVSQLNKRGSFYSISQLGHNYTSFNIPISREPFAIFSPLIRQGFIYRFKVVPGVLKKGKGKPTCMPFIDQTSAFQ